MAGTDVAGFQAVGANASAPFTLKLHRGEGMVLLGMNWRSGQPPDDFVGFAIEYREPASDRFWPVSNRLSFARPDGSAEPKPSSSLRSPIQKFRWVHFPWDASQSGAYTYRVTPVFMDDRDELSRGPAQEADIELRRETYPGHLDVGFTRGFVSSQAFVDDYGAAAIPTLLPPSSTAKSLDFVGTNPRAAQAYGWMGFQARQAILGVLDRAIADKKAKVRAIAYDLDEPEVVSRLEQLGHRLQVIIDDSGAHGASGSAENEAATRLAASAGASNVARQHMGNLQHDKIIVVTGPRGWTAVCGSTNFSWRGFFVQNNNAVVVHGRGPVGAFADAFDEFWSIHDDDAATFGGSPCAVWRDLGLAGIDAKVTFSPHAVGNAVLADIATDIEQHTTSSLFYSLAFLYQTEGPIKRAIEKVTADDRRFVYGISDEPVGGLEVQTPGGNRAVVSPAALRGKLPAPFKAEPTGGKGIRMHHKFVVIDVDEPTARVYFGSYNFSSAADRDNGENLLLVRDRRVATAYMVEAVRIFDHYEFRLAQEHAHTHAEALLLARPPRTPGEVAWFAEDWVDPAKIKDRLLFA